MSYVSQGVIGLIIGLVLIIAVLGLLLVILSIIMLVYGLSNIVPGSLPGRCGTWGHDWRRQLPGLPAGTTCRNCLVRKDGDFIAWRAQPLGIPTMFDMRIGVMVPLNAPKHAAKRPPAALYLADDARLPRVPFVFGQPVVFPGGPAPPPIQLVMQGGGYPPAPTP